MGEKKVQTRERILGAAGAALLQRGPVEPGVGEVMGAAGLTVGGFYAHFENKEALMLEVFQQMLCQRRERVAQLDPALPGQTAAFCWLLSNCLASTAMPASRAARCPAR